MVFSSFVFICFFLPAILFFYYIIPGIKAKNIILLLASLFFYAWGEPKYVILLLAIALINYLFGLLISEYKRFQRLLLVVGVSANILLLCYFKYFNFIIENINRYLNIHLVDLQIVLPLGISFYTFQGLSYLIDVYRYYSGKYSMNEKMCGCEVQKNPINLLLYISFFPQLVAGPIIRYTDINHQLLQRTYTSDKVTYGLERFTYGLAKKVIIADSLGDIADKIFLLNPNWLDASTAWIGVICFTFQIYFDFMGYSDMAIGLASLFGFQFSENFNYPYISKSVSEFWRRWHISLSSWFRDYVYIPLGGSRKGNVYLHLLIVFILTGIWHGAEWSFVIWGLWHGMFIIIERWLSNRKHQIPSLPALFKFLYTMLIVVFGWVFFKAETLRNALYYFKSMLFLNHAEFQPFGWRYYLNNKILFILFLAVVLSIFPFKKWFGRLQTFKSGDVIVKAYSILVFILCLIVLVNSNYSPFIYFRF